MNLDFLNKLSIKFSTALTGFKRLKTELDVECGNDCNCNCDQCDCICDCDCRDADKMTLAFANQFNGDCNCNCVCGNCVCDCDCHDCFCSNCFD